MNKIAVVSESLVMGGTEVAIIALIKKFIDNGNEVTLYLISQRGVLLDRIPPECKVVEIDFLDDRDRYIADFSLFIPRSDIFTRIRRKVSVILFSQTKYDLYEHLLNRCMPVNEDYDLVCDAFGYGRFTTAFAAVVLKGKKKALWFHDENLHWINKTEKYFKYFNKLFCVSESVKKQLIELSPDVLDKSEVLYNFIDTNEIKSKADELIEIEFQPENNIVTIGRLEEQKGIDVAIESAKILQNRNVRFHWYVIGDGSQRNYYMKLIEKYGIEGVFTLLGMKENPYPYLKQCDLYVQPSRHEGYPITLIEARTLNCPIIATDIPSIAEQIKNDENGLLVELKPESLALKIDLLINHPEICLRLKNVLKNEVIDFNAGYKNIQVLLET